MAYILFCTVYILLFSFIILKSVFFKMPGFKNVHALLLFYLKLLSGVALWYSYLHLSPNRFTSDIFKYYDDGALMYSCIRHRPFDFIKMVTGIGDSSPAIQAIYAQMNTWANGDGSSLSNTSHFIIRLNALFMCFSQGHYGVHVIFMCFISLAGLILLYKRFYPQLRNRRRELLAAIFLFPSVLIWGSGILKEALIFFGIGVLLYYFEKLVQRRGSPAKNVILVLLALILLFENKAYAALCLLPCLVSDAAINRFAICRTRPGITYIAITALYLLAGLNINFLGAPVSPLAILAEKQTDFNRIANGGIYLEEKNNNKMYALLPAKDTSLLVPVSNYTDSLLHCHGIEFMSCPAFTSFEIRTRRFALFTLHPGVPFKQFRIHTTDTAYLFANDSTPYWIDVYGPPAKSRIHLEPIKPTMAGLAAKVPQALIISLVRPFPYEIDSLTALLDFAENILIWALILIAISSRIASLRRNSNAGIKFPASPERQNAFYLCLTYCLLMLILIGLVTPLYGGIERYRSLAMPFLLILLLLTYDTRTQS